MNDEEAGPDERERLREEIDYAKNEYPLGGEPPHVGRLTRYTCPECHGVLMRIEEGPLTRYRCQIGHAFSQEALLAGVNDNSADTLAQALRLLQEHTFLLEEVAGEFQTADDPDQAERFRRRAKEVREQARSVQELMSRQHRKG